MLLTRAPLIPKNAFDLHVLGLPPAFVLSQDQTLMLNERSNQTLSSHPAANSRKCENSLQTTKIVRKKQCHFHKADDFRLRDGRWCQVRRPYARDQNPQTAARASLPSYPHCQKANQDALTSRSPKPAKTNPPGNTPAMPFSLSRTPIRPASAAPPQERPASPAASGARFLLAHPNPVNRFFALS